MKNRFVTGRRELFKKLASAAGALGLAAVIPLSAEAGTTVQWTAVTSGGLTVGGQTNLTAGGVGLNNNIVTGAIAAIVAAGGPKLSKTQVILLGGTA